MITRGWHADSVVISFLLDGDRSQKEKKDEKTIS